MNSYNLTQANNLINEIKKKEMTNENNLKPLLLDCEFCKGKGLSKYVDMNDEAIPFGVVDWDKYCKVDKCPECNGSGLKLCNN